jgi:hypothetical protein
VSGGYLVECPRCGAGSNEPLWLLTRRERTPERPWPDLCAKCYRAVMGREPPDQFERENLRRIWRRRGLI